MLHGGVVRERSGNTLLRAAPSNVYRTGDEKWIAIGGNGENVFRRFARAMGMPGLANDPRFVDNRARIANVTTLDEIISAWVAARPLATVQALLDEAGVPAGPVASIADIAADPQFQARGMIATVPDARMPEGHVTMPGIIPTLTATPGVITHSGGALGADDDAVYGGLLGLSPADLADLRQQGVIAPLADGS
jgi:formyl-CoA transferase